MVDLDTSSTGLIRACAAVALLVWVFGPGAAGAVAQEATAELAEKYRRDFTAPAGKSPEWGFFGAGAEKFVKFEPEGVRLTLPAGHEGLQPEVGLVTRLAAKGDFEVTVRYEILAEPAAAEAEIEQTRFTLGVLLAPPKGDVATLSRRITQKRGTEFLSWMRIWDKDKMAEKAGALPAKDKSGRLRMVRTGGTLFFQAADGDAEDFRPLMKQSFGGADLVEVRFVASTGGPKAALDVRITELQIRAEAMPKPPAAPPPPKVALPLNPPAKEYAQEYFQSFQGKTTKPEGWELEGPNAERNVQFEAGGVHITLPSGWKGDRKPTGLKTTFGIKGDFEITMSFEILAETPQADAGYPVGTRLNLGVVKVSEHGDVTTLSRAISSKFGRVFVGWASVWSEEAGKWVQNTGNNKPTKAMAGRLRLVRSGADIYYGVSEGLDGEFKYFKKFPFGPEDVREVRIISGTATELSLLDARVKDLRIRADAIPNMPASAAGPAGQAGAPGQSSTPAEPSGKGWVALTLGVGIAIPIFAALAIGGVMIWRRRNPTAPAQSPAAVVFTCPDCGKKRKVKAELLGKTVKCSQCGKAVLVADDKDA